MTELIGPVKQRRLTRREEEEIYQDVLMLRRMGLACYRRGVNHHSVNGRYLSTEEMRKRAAALREKYLTE